LGRREVITRVSSKPAAGADVSGVGAGFTARSRRNRRAMRTSARMPEEGANLVGSFRRQNVLEFAGLLFDFRFAVHGQAVGEQPLGKAVAADDAASPFPTAGRKRHNQGSVTHRGGHRLQRIVTRIYTRRVIA